MREGLHILQSLGSIQRRAGDESWEQQHVKDTHFKWVEKSKVNAAVLTNMDDVSALVSALVDEFDLSVQFWLGAVIFSGALFLFARAQPAAAAKQEQPLEPLSAGSE